MHGERGPELRVEVVNAGTPAQAQAAVQVVRALLARWFAERQAGVRSSAGGAGGTSA